MTTGEIHWVDLPDTGGREQAGRRPAIIIQNDGYAGSLPTVLVIPLSSAIHTPWAGSNSYKDFGAQYRSGFDSQSIPFVLVTFLPEKLHWASAWLLQDTLQHSILGPWLTATQAGVPPACLQTISSSHVQHFVIRDP
jgi:hypothetical protein